VLVVNRFRVPDGTPEAAQLRADLTAAHEVLAAQRGYVEGHLGRNVDDPDLWVLATRWDHVGAYRRALSTYDAKLTAVPVLGRALDEPSAYEIVTPGAELNRAEPRDATTAAETARRRR
jgi:hypothetical protein